MASFALMGLVITSVLFPLSETMTAILGGLLVSFLVLNKPAAKLYFGDVGSNLVGAAWVYLIYQHLSTPTPLDIWHLLLLFSPLVLDATATLLVGLSMGIAFWRPHRRHGYQRLALAKGVKVALTVELILMWASALCVLGLVAWSFE